MLNYRQGTIKRGSLDGLIAVLLAVLFSASASSVYAQGGATRYVYDDNGRLRAVVAPNGEANVYQYDATGNITAIRRNTATTLEVLGFSPRVGVPGTQVTIVGTGFGGGINAVAFNGTAAQIVSTNAPVVVVNVPNGATTGPISVTTAQGSTTTAQSFVVRGVKLTPIAASLNPSQTVQFTAQVFPLETSQSVKWSVNDIDGGNATVGTINASGLYTAPVFPFSPATIRATSVAEPSLFEEARVTLFSAPPIRAPVAAGLSVQRAPATAASTTFALAGAGVSVRRDAPVSTNTIAPVGAGVSVRRDTPMNSVTIAPVGAGVSIRRDAPAAAMTIAPVGAGVSIRRDAAANSTTLAPASPSVSATKGPYISAIAPGSLAKNATTNITISGANLAGATSLIFIDGSGASDASITAANLAVNGGGTVLTANVTTSSTTALGQRLVIVTTASNRSLSVGTGTNVVQIVP